MKTENVLLLAAAAGVGYLALTKREEIEEITSDLAGSVPGIQIINEALQPLSEAAATTFEIIIEAGETAAAAPAAAAEAVEEAIEGAAETISNIIPEIITVDLPEIKVPEVVLFPETSKRYGEAVGATFQTIDDIISFPLDVWDYSANLGWGIGQTIQYDLLKPSWDLGQTLRYDYLIPALQNLGLGLRVGAGMTKPITDYGLPVGLGLATHTGIMPLIAQAAGNIITGTTKATKTTKTTKKKRKIITPIVSYPTVIKPKELPAIPKDAGFMDLTNIIFGGVG